MTKRNVLIVSDGDDMAGVNYGLKAAFDRHSDRYKLRQVRGTDNYIGYPVDIVWWGNNTLVNSLYGQSELVHISEYPWALDGGVAPKIWDKVPKPTVVHQHGTPFRNNPGSFLNQAKQKRFKQIVSTIDLLIDPSLTWLPNPVNMERMKQIRNEEYPYDGIIRIGQAPTNRSIKQTAEFVAACEKIKDRLGKKFDYFVIENRPWEETLRLKARCDIWFDQLTFGYGSNGIEAGAMGLPVVGGFSDPKVEQRLIAEVGGTPTVAATTETLDRVLNHLVDNVDARAEAASRAYDYMLRVHSEDMVVRRLEEIYDRTIDEFEARTKSRTTSL